MIFSRTKRDAFDDTVIKETDAPTTLPVYAGMRAWFTDCTCAKRSPGRFEYQGRWIHICMQCGSTRQNTGT